ncbi:VOC family protein [Fulvivirgaceae bacterium BMA12]|uniref:VOC family protein n=1 Tax=Agaribacillus aureus TaxID=3051825 RepID=A0ABT8LD78_9BACT|nr:VOC family protein [Fulvivirgaceae bacterium BMA12]
MSILQIKETCLYIQDIKRSIAFYNGKLEFPIIDEKENRHVFFRVGASVLLCFIAETTKKDEILPPHFGSGTQHLAFEVTPEDYEKYKEIMKDKDIAITHEHTWKEGIKSFYFEDPDGHVLEIVPRGMWD